MRTIELASIALATCSGFAVAQIPDFYQVVALADLLPARGASSTAKAVSHSGHVVGSFTDVSLHSRAVMWERTGTSTWRAIDLAQETGLTRGWSQALDVNDRGEVTGTYLASFFGMPIAMKWYRNSFGNWVAESIGPGDIRSINNDSEFARNTSTGDIITSSWRAPSGPIVPRPLKGIANAINDPGAIVGIGGSGPAAVAFISRNIATPFAEILPGVRPAEALGINQQQRIVGATRGTGGAGQAALWEPVGTTWKVVSLHPSGATSSTANGINDLSQVVGWASGTTVEPFLYDVYQARAIDLRTRVSAPAWKIEQPFDINNAGEIVGTGRRNGAVVQAFLLRPVRNYSFVRFPIKPSALNNRAQVVGNGFVTGAGLWNQGTFMPIGSASTDLWDINDDYRIVGVENGGNAAVWATPYWIRTVLAGPQGGSAQALGVSNSNLAVGRSAFETVTWLVDAPASAPIQIKDDVPGGCSIFGKDGNHMVRINPGSFAAGTCFDFNGERLDHYAASWSPRHDLQSVNSGASLGERFSQATGINNSAVIAGTNGSSNNRRPFLFDPRVARPVSLPRLNSIPADGVANAINSRGVVVGFSRASNEPRAVLWTEQQQVIDINLLLSPSDRSRWILINALAINDAGQIAGTARSVTDASLSGFLLTPATQ